MIVHVVVPVAIHRRTLDEPVSKEHILSWICGAFLTTHGRLFLRFIGRLPASLALRGQRQRQPWQSQARFWSRVQIPKIANFFFDGRRTEIGWQIITGSAQSIAWSDAINHDTRTKKLLSDSHNLEVPTLLDVDKRLLYRMISGRSSNDNQSKAI